VSRYPTHARRPFRAGAFLLVTASLYYLAFPAPEFLNGLYQDAVYRVVTGLVLAALVGWQWYYALARRRQNADARTRFVQHLWLGSLSPLLLFVHALSTGYGYQTVLAWTLLFNCALGLLSPMAPTREDRVWVRLWLPLHIVTSILVIALITIHVTVVLRFS